MSHRHRARPAGRGRAAAGLLAAAALGLGFGCSAVRSVYVHGTGVGAAAASEPPVKRLAVGAWAASGDAGLAGVLAAVGEDLVKLRKNYLVYAAAPVQRHWAEACADRVEAVLLVRSLDGAVADGGSLALHLTAELYRCGDGTLLWRAEAGASHPSADAALAQLTDNYAQAVGPAARRFAAPSFVLLQQLVAKLPDVTLNDADIAEKIELG